MAEVYAILIINGRRKIEDIRPELREAVITSLIAKGYDTEGNKIESAS